MLLLAAPQRKPEPEPEPGGGSEPALPSVIWEVKSSENMMKEYFLQKIPEDDHPDNQGRQSLDQGGTDPAWTRPESPGEQDYL